MSRPYSKGGYFWEYVCKRGNRAEWGAINTCIKGCELRGVSDLHPKHHEVWSKEVWVLDLCELCGAEAGSSLEAAFRFARGA